MSGTSEVTRAYQQAQDRLQEAQERLALADALGVKVRYALASVTRQDYVHDLERQAFELFEIATELFIAADKKAQGSR